VKDFPYKTEEEIEINKAVNRVIGDCLAADVVDHVMRLTLIHHRLCCALHSDYSSVVIQRLESLGMTTILEKIKHTTEPLPMFTQADFNELTSMEDSLKQLSETSKEALKLQRELFKNYMDKQKEKKCTSESTN
jgi:hypothetical protein